MQTIDDIRFDNNTYTAASYWTLLLYQQDGLAMVIPVPDADLMSFVQVFDDRIQCENHINTNLQKMITLFAYDGNIEPWFANTNSIPHNLQDIKIFCHDNDQSFVARWARRHIHRFKNTNFEIITFGELNHKLLLFGAHRLKKLHSEFQPASHSLIRAHQDYKRLCQVLANYFWHEAND